MPPTLAYIASPKVSDRGTVSTLSSTLSNGSVTNVQDPRPHLKAVFSSGNCYIEGDLGALYPIDTFTIGFINSLSSADIYHFRAVATGSPLVSPLINSGATTIWPPGADLSAYAEIHCRFENSSVQNVRYWRVDFSCSVPPQIGRLFPSLRIEPLQSISVWQPDVQEPIAATVSLGGEETRRATGGAKRGVHLEWPVLSKVEALGDVYELMMERGSSKDYMVSLVHVEEETLNPMAYVYIGSGQLKMINNTFRRDFTAIIDLVELAPLRVV